MSLDKPIILVVDDDGPILALMRNLLKEFGFHPVTADDGAQAITTAQQQRPAVVLLDKNMPGMDGAEVIRALRGTPGLEHVPILMLSGERLTRSELEDLGADDAILKPFDIPVLIEQIRRHLPVSGPL